MAPDDRRPVTNSVRRWVVFERTANRAAWTARTCVTQSEPATLRGRQRELAELNERGAGDIAVVVGGVLPPQDFDFLRESGVKAIFPPGTNIVDAATEVLDLLG